MADLIAEIRADPSPGHCAIAGLLLAGLTGLIVGLVLGLNAYAATAWAAMFEIGIPAAAGGLIGGLIALARRLRRHTSV